MRAQVWLLIGLALLGAATAARMDNFFMREAMDHFVGTPFIGRQGGFGTFFHTMLGRHKGRGTSEFPTTDAYVSIRFVVPPSEQESFEKEWLNLEDTAYSKEEGLNMLGMCSTKLDNLFYVVYGEWNEMRDLADHVESNHFQDFANYVDKHGIRYELTILENQSEEIDEKQGFRTKMREEALERKRGGGKRKYKEEKEVEVLFTYIVPPEVKTDFEDDWMDCALKTVKEDGNIRINLRKVRSDNTRYFSWGNWESYEDLKDHFKSNHVYNLKQNLNDNDIVIFITPMTRVVEGKKTEFGI